MTLKLSFYGAAGQVTGSMFLLEVGTRSLLVDCGFFQGRREESRRRNRSLPPEAVRAEAVRAKPALDPQSRSVQQRTWRRRCGEAHGDETRAKP